MKKRELQVGDVVQIDPEGHKNKIFAGCFMLVTEPKAWGAQGFVTCPDDPSPKAAYLRVKFENMEFIGRAVWVHDEDEDEGGDQG